MPKDTRRTVVAAVGSVLVTGLAGCLSSSDADTTEAPPSTTEQPTAASPTETRSEPSTTDSELRITTPASGQCNPVDPPRPASTPDGIAAESYPEFSGATSAAESSRFAVSYERAFQYNQYLSAYSYADIERVSVQNLHDATATHYRGGFLVAVDGELDTSRDGLAEDFGFGAWYYLTERFALRHATGGTITDDRPETFSPSQVVGCE